MAVLDESMEPEDFNNAVSEIIKDLDSNKIEADRKTRLVSALGSKLKDVHGLKLEEKDGVKTTDDSIFVAIGLTSYDDKGTTVTLGLKSNVATSGNASRLGEFTVEVEAGGQTYSKLKVPVEITVTLPADLVASMANASKTYTLKIGGEEIPFELDESNNMITFTTDTLGRFIITEKTEVEPDPEPEPKPDTKPEPEPDPKPDTKPEPEPEKKPDRPSSGSYGTVSGGSGRKTPANRNASGSWVLDARGWWFKYTTGGYPANKWEMVKNKWYYFNADGYMVTGWQLIGNAWYHLDDVNGDMTTGWYQDSTDGKWYYLDANGTMKTGWQLIKGNYYYLSQDTTASTYAFDATTQKWVYSKTKARPYGSMYVNEVTPDGYTVNAGGVWVK